MSAQRAAARAPGAALRLYGALSPALAALAPLAAPLLPKLSEGLRGRRGLDERIEAAAAAAQGCVWFHVTSVGEYEQARPLIAALRGQPGHPPLVVTHFSPSGRHFAERRPCADIHEYLPLDRPRAMERLVAAWRPRLLVFVKFDCWPNQVLAADRAGVPIVLMAGSLGPAARACIRWRARFTAISSTASRTSACARGRTSAASSTNWACTAPSA
jgi:3-deoxy-D-manno-octulosonic-acid transferase